MADGDLNRIARYALGEWELGVLDVQEVSRSENIVFRLEGADGNLYVLRLHRPGYHSLEELVSEQIWTSALAAAGFNVPVPLMTRAGAPYGRVRVLEEDRFTGVLTWVSGETMDILMQKSPHAHSAGLRFRQLGRLLGRLHNHSSNWSPPAGFRRHALDEHGLAGERPFWGPFWDAACLSEAQRTRFTALRAQIFDILSGLPKEAASFSLIHADLHPGNVVVNGEQLHVIDFDDSGFGWHAYDLAVAMKDYQDHPQFEHFRDALIQGYRSVRQLPDQALSLLPLFLLVRALVSVGWADARPELDHPDYAQRLVSYVEEKADPVLMPYS